MNKTFQKFKTWYHGKHIPYTLQEMMDLQRDRFGEPKTKPLPERFEPPLIARIINYIWHFWLRHKKLIIETIIGVGLLIVAILTYCRKVP